MEVKLPDARFREQSAGFFLPFNSAVRLSHQKISKKRAGVFLVGEAGVSKSSRLCAAPFT